MKCDGEERHDHYSLNTGTIISHIHTHSDMKEDFNRLHHHAPLEHDLLSPEQLSSTAEITTRTPF